MSTQRVARVKKDGVQIPKAKCWVANFLLRESESGVEVFLGGRGHRVGETQIGAGAFCFVSGGCVCAAYRFFPMRQTPSKRTPSRCIWFILVNLSPKCETVQAKHVYTDPGGIHRPAVGVYTYPAILGGISIAVKSIEEIPQNGPVPRQPQVRYLFQKISV